MFVKLPRDWFYQIRTNSPIEDNVIAVGLQVDVSSPVATLVFKACCENILWYKNTCYLEVGFKACENIHLSENTDYRVKIPIGLQSSLSEEYYKLLCTEIKLAVWEYKLPSGQVINIDKP